MLLPSPLPLLLLPLVPFALPYIDLRFSTARKPEPDAATLSDPWPRPISDFGFDSGVEGGGICPTVEVGVGG